MIFDDKFFYIAHEISELFDCKFYNGLFSDPIHLGFKNSLDYKILLKLPKLKRIRNWL